MSGLPPYLDACNYVLGKPTQCNMASGNPCCSQYGWCDSTPDHCGKPRSIDYRKTYDQWWTIPIHGNKSAEPIEQEKQGSSDKGSSGSGSLVVYCLTTMLLSFVLLVSLH